MCVSVKGSEGYVDYVFKRLFHDTNALQSKRKRGLSWGLRLGEPIRYLCGRRRSTQSDIQRLGNRRDTVVYSNVSSPPILPQGYTLMRRGHAVVVKDAICLSSSLACVTLGVWGGVVGLWGLCVWAVTTDSVVNSAHLSQGKVSSVCQLEHQVDDKDSKVFFFFQNHKPSQTTSVFKHN